jgi:hypothetical protein
MKLEILTIRECHALQAIIPPHPVRDGHAFPTGVSETTVAVKVTDAYVVKVIDASEVGLEVAVTLSVHMSDFQYQMSQLT